ERQPPLRCLRMKAGQLATVGRYDLALRPWSGRRAVTEEPSIAVQDPALDNGPHFPIVRIEHASASPKESGRTNAEQPGVVQAFARGHGGGPGPRTASRGLRGTTKSRGRAVPWSWRLGARAGTLLASPAAPRGCDRPVPGSSAPEASGELQASSGPEWRMWCS